MSNSILLEGYLECSGKKRGELLRGIWKKRWFVLDNESLVYYSARPPHAQQIGSIRLGEGGCSVWKNSHQPTRIDLRNRRDDSLILRGSTVEEISRWTDIIVSIIRRTKNIESQYVYFFIVLFFIFIYISNILNFFLIFLI